MSNLKIVIVSLLILLNQIAADETPGIKVYAKGEAIQNVAEFYLPGILQYLEGVKIPLDLVISDSSTTGNAGAFSSYLNATFVGIDTLNLADNEGSIILNDQGDIAITLQQLNIGIDLGYDMMNSLFTDLGDIKLSTSINNIFTVIHPSIQKNVIQLQNKNLTFEMRATQFKFNSTYWVFILVNQIEGLISTLTADLLTLLIPYVKDYAIDFINGKIADNSQFFRALPIPSTGFTVDLGLYGLNINSQFAELSLNGTFMDLKNPGRHCPEQVNPLPSSYLTTDDATLKIQISDYVLDSLIYVLYDNNLMALAIDGATLPASITQLIQLTTTFLDALVPGMSDVFGSHNATLGMNITEYFSFQLDQANNWILMAPSGYIDFLVDDYSPKALGLRINFDSEIKLGASFSIEGQTLKIRANITEFALTNITAAYVHEGITYTGATLQTQMNALLNLVKGLVNNLDIPITLPSWFTLSDLELAIGQHALELGINPKSQTLQLLIKELLSKIGY